MKAATLDALRQARRDHRPVVLATWLDSGAQRILPAGPPPIELAPLLPTAGAPIGASDSANAEPTARARPDDHALEQAAARALRTDRAEVVETEAGEVLLEPHNPPLRLLLIGAVHIAHALAAMAELAGFAVTIIDPRRAFATAARFPSHTLVTTWPDEAVRSLQPDTRTAVVTLTHDPKLDDPALVAALRTPAFYLGCLGSKKTHASRLTRLAAAGFDSATLGRLHGPVGLSIGARAPAEIAVSVLAQIIAALRGGE